jgi:hypothetical protein
MEHRVKPQVFFDSEPHDPPDQLNGEGSPSRKLERIAVQERGRYLMASPPLPARSFHPAPGSTEVPQLTRHGYPASVLQDYPLATFPTCGHTPRRVSVGI